jgi:periplasmic protein TonB
MERPSHIDINTHQSLSHRLPFVALAFSLQFAVFWLFAHGLAGHVIRDVIHIIDVVPVHQKAAPPIAPPKPTLIQATMPTAPKPEIPPVQGPKGEGINVIVTPPSGTGTIASVLPDRAPISITSTHTVPPYPPIARRLGVEGKVMLRLTVSPEGRVSMAEVVTSSGREDLDQTAQQWIVSHWAYKPALDSGVAIVSHALATVTFSLQNER